MSAWADNDFAFLRACYAAAGREPVSISAIATAMGRSHASVALKASRLGLTNIRRNKVSGGAKPAPRKFATKKEAYAALGAATKARIAEKGHPRGMLGKNHSAEAKAAVSEGNRRAWRDPGSAHRSEAASQRRSDIVVARVVRRAPWGGHLRTLATAGVRDDIGLERFKSAWEANYARYLNVLSKSGAIFGWLYEPKTFVFESIKRGVRTYTPDFKVVGTDGSVEWHEVKGWLDETGALRLERMASHFPGEKVVVRGESWFAEALKSGLAKSIKGWEFKGAKR